MFKQLLAIAFIAAIAGCNPRSSSQDSTAEESTDFGTIAGLWISQDYVRNLKKHSSITIANRDADFFISILITSESQVEALGAEEIEPAIGQLVQDSIKFDYGSHNIVRKATDRIEITAHGRQIEFERLNHDGYHNTYEGRDYAWSLLILGTWQLLDLQLNQFSTITFKLNNQLSGLADITSYYPSSYLDTDILLLGNNKEIKRSFTIRKSDSVLVLDEVENFDWDERPLKQLGRAYKLER